LCVYASYVVGKPAGSTVQIEVGEVARNAFGSLAQVEQTFKGLLRDVKFTPERALGTEGLAFSGQLQLQRAEGVTTFRGQWQNTLIDSNGFATLSLSREAQLLALAEKAGFVVPAARH
jgi:hypothetical protein